MSAPAPTAGLEVVIVRAAGPADAEAVARAVRALLGELGSTRSEAIAVEAAFEVILERPSEATVLLAQDDSERPIGLLGVSWPLALRAGGRYGLIQELWVSQGRRGQAVGRLLLDALIEHARRRHIDTLEVGLPRESFKHLEQTRAFYAGNGFESLGQRMRRSIS